MVEKLSTIMVRRKRLVRFGVNDPVTYNLPYFNNLMKVVMAEK